MKVLQAATLFVALCYLGVAAAHEKKFGPENLGPGVAASWAVDDHNSSISVSFTFDNQSVTDPGFVAIGLSETGSMKGADIWVLDKANGSTWKLGDYKGIGFQAPVLDASQDVTLLSAAQAPNGTITATLRRPLITCDTTNDIPIRPGVPLYVIWAFGPGALSYHGPNRGSKMLVLNPAEPANTKGTINSTKASPSLTLNGTNNRSQGTTQGGTSFTNKLSLGGGSAAVAATKGQQGLARRFGDATFTKGSNASDDSNSKPAVTTKGGAPSNGTAPGNTNSTSASAGVAGGNTTTIGSGLRPGSKLLNLTLPRLSIPSNQTTTYLVQYIKLPADKKRWVLRYAPLFTHSLVHHAVVYSCAPEALPAVNNLTARGNYGPYDENDVPLLCHDFWMVATPNQKPWEAPKDSGLPFGPNHTTWVAVEVHYNNPRKLEGQVDPGSGVWLEYTEQKQAQDVGLLTLTQLDLVIPPGKAVFAAPTAVCPGSCTKRFTQPITLLDQGYHMHGLGKAAKTRRFRDGKEQAPLYQLNSYDYGYQNFMPVPAQMNKLWPGERLELTCVFNSTDRNTTTRFGPGTNDEMCFHWIYYVPAQANMGICSSEGNSTLAACSPGIIPAMALAQSQRGNPEMQTAVAQLINAGQLVQVAANETAGAALYNETCTGA